MRRSRAKLLLALAVATVMLEWLAQPTLFVAGPMLAVAVFLGWWALAPAHVDLCVSRLPLPIAKRVRVALEWISELIEGNDGLSNERKNYFRQEFRTLPQGDIDYIRQMVTTGHAHNPPNDTWTRLSAIGFVFSDYSGPKGIKPELIGLVSNLLDEHERQKRQGAIDGLGELFKRGTMILQHRVHNDEEFDRWKTDMDQWVDEVARVIRENFGEAQEALFMMLETPMAADVQGHYNAKHNHELLHLNARLKKLRRLIEKHS